MYRFKLRAFLHLGAFAANRHAFFECALPDGTKALAINGFHPIDTATFAVDVLRQDGSMV